MFELCSDETSERLEAVTMFLYTASDQSRFVENELP